MDIKRLAEPLMGNSLLFIENNEMWNMHRKAMSGSLYKDKLIKYTGIINQNVSKVISEIEAKFADTGVEMDLIAEVQGVFTRIILDSAFGDDFETKLFDYVENGVVTKKPMGRYLF
jgi:cytochrome P450